MTPAVRQICGRTLCLVLLAAVASGGPPAARADEAVDQQKLEQLRRTIDQLQRELRNTKGSRDEVRRALEASDKDVGALSRKARELEQELRQQQRKLEDLRDERSQLHQHKSEQQKAVGDYIGAAYRLGQQSQLRLLLNQQDAAQVARNLRYYEYFARARADKIAGFRTTIARLDQLEPDIAYQAARSQRAFDDLQAQRRQLEQAQAKRRTLLDQLDARIVTQDQRLQSLLEDRQQLQRLLKSVVNNIDDVNLAARSDSFASQRGKLNWPARGKILHNFGKPRVSDKLLWQGMLIGAEAGQPVRAVHYGRVVFADYLRGHGLLLILDHGGGYLSLYAHNQSLYKTLGEWVDSGDIIATVGSSGGQQQSALYFELRHNGEPTNPRRWLKAA